MRVFKTKWFTREARANAIDDGELCKAIEATLLGKADNLGGGVYKKRLNKNRDRAIILAKGAAHWFYTFLYAKQDIANIDNRELARHYSLLSEEKMAALVKRKELVEICHDCKN